MIGGCDAVALAQRFGTPLYVVDEARIRRACREYVQSFAQYYPKTRIIYAGKAFMNTAIVLLVMDEGLSIDVCSGGELHTALAAGCPGDEIFFHGNTGLHQRWSWGWMPVCTGSCRQPGRAQTHRRHRAFTRAGSQRHTARDARHRAHTHDYIRTGQIDSKFES